MGTIASTVRTVVDRARERGEKVGALRVRMFRPFPMAALERALAGKARVAFLDRNLSPGLGGVLWAEGRGTAPSEAIVQDYVVGLGGGDVRPEHIEQILADLSQRTGSGEPKIVEVA
jgi:pyruvate/2-oxoacid:ferredoxin oxidoreductase alpha subunit